MSKVIVTGINGFVAHHLADALLEAGHNVVGVGREVSPASELAPKLQSYIRCDLTDSAAVAELPLEQAAGVINLAGLAAVGPSFDNPQLYMEVNTGVLKTVADTAIKKRASVRIIAVSSGAVYRAGQPMPLTENSATDPESSPYAKSKLAMEGLALEYRQRGVDTVIARPFNHIGPGQGLGFLLPDLYTRVTEAHKAGNKLAVGNLTTRRDYTDVRDVARAYVRLLNAGTLVDSVFNVCTGRSIAGEDILDMLLNALGYHDLTPDVDQSLFRPSDAPDLFGDASRLREQTGWQPTIDIEQAIADYVQEQAGN